MNEVLARLRYRLLPALLTAFGVILVGSGLLSYTTAVEMAPEAPPLASYQPLPSLDPAVVLPGASADPSPTFPPDRVATRVVVGRLGIDLPVLLQPSGSNDFPFCDVALYFPSMGQPGEGRATYIYAHARKGMFLPLLTASQVNNGQKLIGLTVEVYTSDNWLYLYTISQVRRHTSSLADAYAADTEQLWLQTSEGPNNSYPKLQVVADFLSASRADPVDAHPVAHPRVCA
jgi:hypothetical protein